MTNFNIDNVSINLKTGVFRTGEFKDATFSKRNMNTALKDITDETTVGEFKKIERARERFFNELAVVFQRWGFEAQNKMYLNTESRRTDAFFHKDSMTVVFNLRDDNGFLTETITADMKDLVNSYGR